MDDYPCKQLSTAPENVTPAHGTVLKLIRKVEVIGHTHCSWT
jgi:chromosome condensin MukBEF ATPase and DNA-binding subunit MukB